MTLNDYVEKMSVGFALPDTCNQIQSLLKHHTTHIDEIAEVVMLDPLISSSLIKLANSALYNVPSEVDTVTKAISVLGVDAVYSLVMICGTANTLGKLDPNVVDLDLFWQQSINTSLIAKQLAPHFDKKAGEYVFLLGLMQNLGELVVAHFTPELAKICLNFDKMTLPHQIQESVLDFNYAQLSAALFDEWNFPSKMGISIRNSIKPTRREPELLIFLASRLALINNYPDFYTIESIIPVAVTEHYRFKRKNLENLIAYANLESFNVFNMINPQTSAIV